MTPLLLLTVGLAIGQSPDSIALSLRTGTVAEKVEALKLVRDMASEKFVRSDPKKKGVAPDPTPYLLDVIAQLADRSSNVRYWACEALMSFREGAVVAVPNLRKILAEDNTSLRARAAVVIGLVGPPAKDAVPELIKCLALNDPRDADPQTTVAGVVSSAVLALRAIGPDAEAAVPDLMKMLVSDKRHAQDNALIALGGIRSETAKVLPEVLKIANDVKRDGDQRRLAMRVVGELGVVNDEVVKLVSTALFQPLDDTSDELPLTHDSAIRALGDLGPKALTDEMLDRLIALLVTKTVNHQALVMTLGKLGPKAKKAVPALKACADYRSLAFSALVADAIQAIEKK